MSRSGKIGIGPSARDLMLTVIANGKPVNIEAPLTLDAFLIAQHLPPRSVVVEHNGEAVSPSEFSARTMHDGDRVEIVRIVAGG